MAIEVNKIRIWALTLVTLFSPRALANDVFLPATPGVSLSGYAGNGWNTQADAMAPVFGSPLNFTYIDPQINYSSSNEYSGNLGIGQRWLKGDSIWGAYVFGDYNRSVDNQSFWFVSPGVERLGRTWDFSANGYIPVTKTHFNTGTEFADETCDSSQIHFSGHDQYDELVNTFESTGWGADAQIGAHLPWRSITLSLGSYFFTLENNHDIIGATVGAQVPINNYLSVSLSEAYDNEAHNTLKAGISISLGGRHSGLNNADDLRQRLVDPVQRQLIMVKASAHTGEPVSTGVQDLGKTAIEMSNISFFVPGGTTTSENISGDGTYENPYQGFSQNTVNNANQQNNRNFYLNSGVYNPEYAADSTAIILNNDQLYGRQNNFSESAEGDNRPLINFSQSGLAVADNDTKDSVNGLILTGTNIGDGIAVNHSDNSVNPLMVSIDNVSIHGFDTGIYLNNTSSQTTHIKITDADISGNLDNAISALNCGNGGLNLRVNDSAIENNGGSGLYITDYHSGDLTVNINRATIMGNADNGIYAINEFNPGTLSLDVKNSTISANGYNGIQLYNGTGTYNTNTGDLISNIENSNINGNGANGIIANNTSTGSMTLNIKNSEIDDNSINGIEAINTGDTGSFYFTQQSSDVSGNQLNGLEIFNENNSGSFNISIFNSNFANNIGDGMFMDNSESSGDMTVAISRSKVDGNGRSGIYALNDLSSGSFSLAISRTELNDNARDGIFIDNKGDASLFTVDVTSSNISNNALSGISAFNESQNGDIDLSVDRSLINDNHRNGISLNETSDAHTLTAEINGSSLINNNANAIAANNGSVVTLNKCIVQGTGGISAMKGATVIINNPVYFNGDINNQGSAITFNDVTVPAGATHAVCTLGICTFS
jgi:hypothetical protein